MPTKTISSLQLLLNSYHAKNKTEPTATPYNGIDLSKTIEFSELAQNITLLEKLLQTPESFEVDFKKQCVQRALNKDGMALPLTMMPTSLTNQLYWQIAQLVFNPRNLHQMLAIVLPPGERLKAIQRKDCLGLTVLCHALTKPESVNVLLTSLTGLEQLKAAELLKNNQAFSHHGFFTLSTSQNKHDAQQISVPRPS